MGGDVPTDYSVDQHVLVGLVTLTSHGWKATAHAPEIKTVLLRMLRHKMALSPWEHSAFEGGGDLFATRMQMVGQRDPCPDTLGAGVHAESVGPLCVCAPFPSGAQVSGWLSYANSNVSCATCQKQASCEDPFSVSSCP
jgi:hypothetical protein